MKEYIYPLIELLNEMTPYLLFGFLIAGILVGGPEHKHGTIKEVMRDAVLHEDHKISLLGLLDVNPAVISAFTVTGILLAETTSLLMKTT